MAHALIELAIAVLIVGFLAGLFIFLIRRAPIIPAEFKAVAEWLIIVVAVLILVLKALPLIGVSI